ncbi:MAG: malectin domain-containing carbohydrate-binding protein, partial [Algisphaera sp.]
MKHPRHIRPNRSSRRRSTKTWFPHASSLIEPLEPRMLYSGDVLYRVNAGGPATDAQDGGPNWIADNPASSFSNASAALSRRYTNIVPIDLSHPSVGNAAPLALFQTERWDKNTGQEMQWDFPVTPGQYQVNLYFAEISNGI